MNPSANNLCRGLLVLSCLVLSAPGLTAPLHNHVKHGTVLHVDSDCHGHPAEHQQPGNPPTDNSGDDHCQTCYQIAQIAHNVVPPLSITIEHAAKPAGLIHAVDLMPHVRVHTPFSSPRAPPFA